MAQPRVRRLSGPTKLRRAAPGLVRTQKLAPAQATPAQTAQGSNRPGQVTGKPVEPPVAPFQPGQPRPPAEVSGRPAAPEPWQPPLRQESRNLVDAFAQLAGSVGQRSALPTQQRPQLPANFGDWVNAQSSMGDGPEAWIRQAMRLTNTPDEEYDNLYRRMIQESNGDPRAQNNWDSNAKKGIPSKGLFQTIDPTFNSYAMEGMNDIWNPVHNAVAAIRYMYQRYGGPGRLPKGGY
jgi:hypothetical protein